MHICKRRYKSNPEQGIISENYENIPATKTFLSTKLINVFVPSVKLKKFIFETGKFSHYV